ncbi:MAG: eukaryotic translation initiation factor 2 subunit alpha-like [Trebouxia sp. A1-2]|nr:MAG: eukaryotic translation initiation factor 2 subunit alpha-like [Trebouxia sp. A1-2]
MLAILVLFMISCSADEVLNSTGVATLNAYVTGNAGEPWQSRNQTLPYEVTYPTQNVSTDAFGTWPIIYEGIECPTGNYKLQYHFENVSTVIGTTNSSLCDNELNAPCGTVQADERPFAYLAFKAIGERIPLAAMQVRLFPNASWLDMARSGADYWQINDYATVPAVLDPNNPLDFNITRSIATPLLRGGSPLSAARASLGLSGIEAANFSHQLGPLDSHLIVSKHCLLTAYFSFKLPHTSVRMSAHQDARMYESKYPEVDDVVMVQVKSIAEMGAYVGLLEYNGIEGMILLSELSRRRIRSITKLIKVGRQEPVMVLRVDKEKGYIDLSKRRVAAEDIQAAEEKYNKSKMVHSIMRHVAETTGQDLEQLYTQIGWPLYKMYGHAFEAFKQMVQDPEPIFARLQEVNGGEPLSVLTDNVRTAIMKNITRRMTPQPLKIRADIDMTCFAYDGVLHIQDAMRAAGRSGTEDCPVQMKLVAPPLYVLTTQTLDKNKGIQVLNDAIEVAEQTIKSHKGNFKVKEAPRTVSERDDLLLQSKMTEAENANKEVAGDSDSEDDFEEGMGDIDVEKASGLTIEQ